MPDTTKSTNAKKPSRPKRRSKGNWKSVQAYAGKDQKQLVVYMNRANRDVLEMLREARARHHDRSMSWIIREALAHAGLDPEHLSDEVKERAKRQGVKMNQFLLKVLRRHLSKI